MGAQEILKRMYDGRVLVFGHRGALAYAPMNTIPAFELAAEQGAHGVELDVHLSLDGKLVVIHDFKVDATTDSTGWVADMTLRKLKTLDAGRWYDEKFAGERIPTLDEVFEAVGERLYVNIEVKSISAETRGIEDAVLECIVEHNMQERVIVSSFNPYVLKNFRLIAPDIPIGYLTSGATMQGPTQVMLNLWEFDAQHLHVDLIDETRMGWAKESRHWVNAWTVNDPKRATELVKLGVNGLITDQPDTVLEAIRE